MTVACAGLGCLPDYRRELEKSPEQRCYESAELHLAMAEVSLNPNSPLGSRELAFSSLQGARMEIEKGGDIAARTMQEVIGKYNSLVDKFDGVTKELPYLETQP